MLYWHSAKSEVNGMTKEEIMQIIPHRDNMLLIDEAYVEDGKAH